MTIPKITPYTDGVANPDGSQTQTEFTQKMFNQLSYEANLATELNSTVDGMNQAVDEVNASASSAENSANAAEAAASGLNYKGLWPDTGGSANKGDTYQTQVGGTPTGQYFTALQNTMVDPVGDDVNWREVISSENFGVQEVTATGSTTPRSLSDRFSDVVNVKDFGAVGDGVADDTQAFQDAMDQSRNVYIPNGVYNISRVDMPRGLKLKGESRRETIVNVLDDGGLYHESVGITGSYITIKDFRMVGVGTNTKGISLTNTAHTTVFDVRFSDLDVGLELNDGLVNDFYNLYALRCGVGVKFNPTIATNLNTFYSLSVTNCSTGIEMLRTDGGANGICYKNTFYNSQLEKNGYALDTNCGNRAATLFVGGYFEHNAAVAGEENWLRITESGRVSFDSVSFGDESATSGFRYFTDDSDGYWVLDGDCGSLSNANQILPPKSGRGEMNIKDNNFIASDVAQQINSEFLKIPNLHSYSSATSQSIESFIYGTASPDEWSRELINVIPSTVSGTTGRPDPIGGNTAVSPTSTQQWNGTGGVSGEGVVCQVFVKVTDTNPGIFFLQYDNNGVTKQTRPFVYNGESEWVLVYMPIPAGDVTTNIHRMYLIGANGALDVWHPQMVVSTSVPIPPIKQGEAITRPVRFTGYTEYAHEEVRRRVPHGTLLDGDSFDIEDLCTIYNPLPVYEITIQENISSVSRVTTRYNAALVLTRTNDVNGVELVSTMTTGTVTSSRVSLAITPTAAGSDKGIRVTATGGDINNISVTVRQVA